MIHPSVCLMCPLLPKQVTKVNDVSAELLWIQSPINVCTIHQIPSGLVVRIRRSHRRVPGSIPHLGTTFFDRFKCDLFFFFILPINVLNVLFNFSQFSFHSFVFIFMSRFESETFQSRVFFKIRVLVKICFNFNQVKQNYWRVIISIIAKLSNFSTVAAVTASDS